MPKPPEFIRNTWGMYYDDLLLGNCFNQHVSTTLQSMLPQMNRINKYAWNIFACATMAAMARFLGSSAGAGSGDFHVYRGVRRREYARQKFLDEQTSRVGNKQPKGMCGNF